MNARKFGIIDIGSNTIRAVKYKDNRPCGDKAVASHILYFTNEGILSEEGAADLISSLLQLKEYLGDVPIYAFATSAMRDVKNFCDIKKQVSDKTGIEIELISGETEAEYDYMAIRSVCADKCGIAVDLGGGSAQVIAFDENGVTESESFAIGVKRMRNAFCKGVIPENAEILNIDAHIEKELSEIHAKSGIIRFMGGTAKAAEIAAKKLFSVSAITPEVLENIFSEICKSPELGKKLFGKRYETMPVGLKVMKKICEVLGGGEMKVCEVGVRDGYAEKITKEK